LYGEGICLGYLMYRDAPHSTLDHPLYLERPSKLLIGASFYYGREVADSSVSCSPLMALLGASNRINPMTGVV